MASSTFLTILMERIGAKYSLVQSSSLACETSKFLQVCSQPLISTDFASKDLIISNTQRRRDFFRD